MTFFCDCTKMSFLEFTGPSMNELLQTGLNFSPLYWLANAWSTPSNAARRLPTIFVIREFTTADDVAQATFFFAAFEWNTLAGQSLIVSHGWFME